MIQSRGQRGDSHWLRWGVGLLLAVVCAACAAQPAAQPPATATPLPTPTATPVVLAGKVTEFAPPSSLGFLGPMAVGPDGTVWFGASASTPPAIGRVNASGDFSQFVLRQPAGISFSFVGGLVTGPDGALWFTVQGWEAGMIGRLTTAGSIRYFRVPGQAPPYQIVSAIAVGSDGALWFTEGLANAIGRITTQGKITDFPLPAASLGNEFRITAGPDGALWFAQDTYDQGSHIGRISYRRRGDDVPSQSAYVGWGHRGGTGRCAVVYGDRGEPYRTHQYQRHCE
jgi:virginiamycin B lyase